MTGLRLYMIGATGKAGSGKRDGNGNGNGSGTGAILNN